MNETGPDTPNIASTRRPWIVAAVAGIVLIGVAYASAFFFADLFNRKAVDSIDEIDATQVTKLSVFVLNRPDGGPDITAGAGELLNVPADEIASVLQPLRGGKAITEKRPVYLGRMEVKFQDGRKVTLLLHRDADNSSERLQYRIGQHGYETQSLAAFCKSLDAMEAKVRTRR